MSDEKNEFKNVVCVKFNDKYKHHRKLVIGKTYLAQIDSNGDYYISDKDNQSRNGLGYYKSDLFVSIDEWRDIKLKELGI
jgi:hypothetical protein